MTAQADTIAAPEHGIPTRVCKVRGRNTYTIEITDGESWEVVATVDTAAKAQLAAMFLSYGGIGAA